MHRPSIHAIFFLAAALGACTSPQSPRLPAPAASSSANQIVISPDSPQLAQIRTETVAAAAVPLGSVTAPGKVEANANRLSHVVLPITGRISDVLVKLGDFVRQGQPVLSVESADADAAVSSFQQAQATLTQSRSALAKAQMDLDRQKDLYEHGAVPQKEVFNAQAVAVQMQAAVEQSQAALEQARRRMQILGLSNPVFGQKVVIHAPISGKVLELSVVNGEYRNDLSAPLLTLADLSSVWITSDVPETAIRMVKLAEAVNIQLAAYPGETFKGRVTLIGDLVDPQTRSVKVRAELANPQGRFKPEMFGNFHLAEEMGELPVVPASALVATDGRSIVWRQLRPGVFEKVPVTTGDQFDNRVAITSGLRAGDKVVVDGVMLLSAN